MATLPVPFCEIIFTLNWHICTNWDHPTKRPRAHKDNNAQTKRKQCTQETTSKQDSIELDLKFIPYTYIPNVAHRKMWLLKKCSNKWQSQSQSPPTPTWNNCSSIGKFTLPMQRSFFSSQICLQVHLSALLKLLCGPQFIGLLLVACNYTSIRTTTLDEVVLVLDRAWPMDAGQAIRCMCVRQGAISIGRQLEEWSASGFLQVATQFGRSFSYYFLGASA